MSTGRPSAKQRVPEARTERVDRDHLETGGVALDVPPEARVAIEGGVGLVEQPQAGAAGHQHGERGATPLSGREAGDRHVGQPGVELDVDVGGICRRVAGRRAVGGTVTVCCCHRLGSNEKKKKKKKRK